jgi:protocatechuate 3,4-dioxygenase alpha subunit
MRTPAQTAGPFFGIALPWPGGQCVVPRWHPGVIMINGQVLDGAGAPVPDALVELWQPDADGRVPAVPGSLRRDNPGCCGFGRCGTDRAGGYWFATVKPGAVGTAAPYGALLVFARGLLKPVATRIYFPEDSAAHATDPVLGMVDPVRRPTLIATRTADRSYRFDVRLQGAAETVFFAFAPPI